MIAPVEKVASKVLNELLMAHRKGPNTQSVATIATP
jgi:hypothetical protein